MSKDYNSPTKTPDVAQLRDAIIQLQPGDTVKATFYDKHYRTFDITGIVTAATFDEGVLLLASWMLNSAVSTQPDGTKDRGKPSAFLKELEILETQTRSLF